MSKLFGDMGNMFKEARSLQSKIKKIQEEMTEKIIDVSSGGGMVTVKINGQQDILDIQIESELLKQNDPQMLQDLVAAAVNEAIKESKELMQEEMGKVTGGVNIPGLF